MEIGSALRAMLCIRLLESWHAAVTIKDMDFIVLSIKTIAKKRKPYFWYRINMWMWPMAFSSVVWLNSNVDIRDLQKLEVLLSDFTFRVSFVCCAVSLTSELIVRACLKLWQTKLMWTTLLCYMQVFFLSIWGLLCRTLLAVVLDLTKSSWLD